MGLKSGERKAERIGSEEKASKGEEEGEEEGGERGVEGVAATAFLKVAVRWSGDLEMAGEAIVRSAGDYSG